jgi:hypothetical protein
VAADYYWVDGAGGEAAVPLIGDATLLRQVEAQPNAGKLLALVDSVRRNGTLNAQQVDTLQLLRAGLLALAEGYAAPAMLG